MCEHEIPVQGYVCVVESKAFDLNLCPCIIYSPMPASLCLFFKACLRSQSVGGEKNVRRRDDSGNMDE